LALQVALVDADEERHSNVLREDAFWEGERELFFFLLSIEQIVVESEWH
jgi:hypothetical protein